MYDSSISTLDLIKLLCIKQDRYNKLPKLRILKRYKLVKERDGVIMEFLNRDIFNQSDALCGVLLNIHKMNPNIILPEMYNYIIFGNDCLDFIFNASAKNDDNIIRDGIVRYTPKEHTFYITMEQYTDEMNTKYPGYAFSYTKGTELNKSVVNHWETDVHEQLKSIYMTTLLYIVNIINSPSYNFIKEEYIMH